MRRLLASVLTLVLGLLGSGVAWAKCPDGQVLKKVGNVQTGSAAISTQGHDIHAISLDCAGTACLAGLINEDTLGGFNEDADVVMEPGAAANSTLFLDLTDSPIYFSSGITFVDDGNVDAIVLYSCQQR